MPDPAACLALSAVSLALNVVANVFLVIRFSSRSERWWRIAIPLSTAAWLGKTLVALANLITFGVIFRNAPGYRYEEGFWCAVVSVIGAGTISVMLVLHYVFVYQHRDDVAEIRLEGKRFMLSVTLFVVILALQALVFSRIEGWTYLDGIYFSVETALTIGFGDLLPTNTSTKVLVFIFSVLTISQLGNEIAIIVSFISSRSNQRRDRWRRHYERAVHREAYNLKPHVSLIEEMVLIHEIHRREDM